MGKCITNNLQEFKVAVARLICLTYPSASEDIMEYLNVQTFVNGIVNEEIQHALTEGSFKNEPIPLYYTSGIRNCQENFSRTGRSTSSCRRRKNRQQTSTAAKTINGAAAKKKQSTCVLQLCET